MQLIIKNALGESAIYTDVRSVVGKVLWPAQSIYSRLRTQGTLLRIDQGFCGTTLLLPSDRPEPCEDL